jgi:trimeric autotransporter adhesin
MPTHEVRPSAFVSCLLLLAGSLLTAPPLAAQVAPQGGGPLSALAFSEARFRPASDVAPLEAVQASLAAEVRSRWASFQAASPVRWQGYVDRRTGHLESAVGGGIRWSNGTTDLTDLKALEAAARAFLPGIAPLLGIDSSSLGASLELDRGRSGRQEDHLWYVDFNVRREGLIVEGARVVFRVSHGNLIEFGAENLPSPDTAVPAARIGHEQALAALSSFVGGFSAADSFIDGGSLHLLPVDLSDPGFASAPGFAPGEGRGLALVWEIVFLRRGDGGTWRARIDAETGKVVELVDLNRYGRVNGGAFPISPVSTPEATLPMPFADVPGAGFADSAGFFTSATTVTSKLDGKYVKINDACGSISKSSDWTGEIAFGSSGGTDCTTPGTGGNGNTHSARTMYYHVNRIKEAGRAWLPTNTWLQGKLTVNVNINLTCNAFWSPGTGTINFYRSGGGCANTGEIAAVALHEYGHGLDSNDGGGGSPDAGTGETYGDFTSALATHDSCIGPGFRATNCTGNGDACTACTGVRDIDYAKHSSNTPATVANFTQVRCGGARPDYPGPCGSEGHCESYVASEALWDFAARDLPDPGSAAAWTITERLWYLSRATATAAFTCSTAASPWTSTGCATGSLWRTLRAADDDDGNLTNGTPHSCQLFAAFNRHAIACATDPGANVCFSGCTPPDAPTLTVTPGTGQVQLNWTDSGAGIVYDLYRSEIGCGSGFVRIADSLAATTYTDLSVAGGLSYSYQLVAHPTGGTSCAAAPTACQSATPSAPVCSPPAAPTGLSVTQGTLAHLSLTWTAVGGATGYNVYRATSLGGPYTLRATVATNAFSDSGLAGGTAYFYTVRAFANACESGDSTVGTATTAACTTVSLYQEDFETGTGLSNWTKQVLAGGSATNDWRGIQACSPAHSGTKIFRFGGATCGAVYGDAEIAVAAPPVIAIPAGTANTRLSFWHRRDFEPGYDGGRVAMTLDDGSIFYFGPDSALSGATYDNAITSGGGSCPPGAMGGVSTFTGLQGTMVNTVVDLDAICDAATSGTGGCAGHTVKPGFLSISDCNTAGAGWFLDDVQVTTCQPPVVGPVPGYYTVTPCRLIDTRNPAGPLGGPPLIAGGERTFLAAGTCGIPASAKALSINLTVVTPTVPGFLQALPGGSPASPTSSISFKPGVTRANNGVLALDGTGALLVRSGATAPVDFIVDVTGYFQ